MATDTPKASPRPWRVEKKADPCLYDANGKFIFALRPGFRWNRKSEEEIKAAFCSIAADAALIVEAVNAHDSIDAETIIRLRAENATLNEAAANLQRSRSAIIADNDRLREALREIQHIARDAMFPARKGIARVRSTALTQIYKFASVAIGEEST